MSPSQGLADPSASTLTLSSCARAATAAETRYRIEQPIVPARGARIVALDEGAAVVASRAAALPWANARFFVCAGVDDGDEVRLQGIGGGSIDVTAQLADADVVVLIATDDSGARSAAALGRLCFERGIMTAGVIVGSGGAAADALAALRPHARVLLPSADETDLHELLTALRA